MSEAEPRPEASGRPSAIAPGRVSAFLKELARVPDGDLAEALTAYRPGMVVGRFELLREIGRGGFGVVFEALDRDLGRRVAFKAIRRAGSRSAHPHLKEEWLRREAEAAAQLSHTNIVALHDFGMGPGGPYLVLELLEGETLQDRLRQGPLPPAEAVRISIEVARALAHSHAAGVLHRDLKPSNVFLSDSGAVKVLDFGLARIAGSSAHPGAGTPSYMAPEQWRAEGEDARTDLFAAGAMLHEMLGGGPPYAVSGGRSAALEPGPTPTLRRPGVPRRLAALVSSAIARRPADRPANAHVWLDGLLGAERAMSRSARAPTRRALVLGAVALGAIALAAAAGLAGFHLSRRVRSPAERVSVAVADFANESGESDLDGLSGMLITSLEQSRRLAVLTRSRMIDVLRQLGREDAARIDEPLAREIGLRTGVRALLIGSIRRFEGTYRVELRALDPTADAYLFAVRAQGRGKASIPGLVDDLSEQTRERLREGADEIRTSAVRMAEVATPSTEAYQHYFLGLDCVERPSRYPSHPQGCLEELRKAVAIDPGFALAWFQLSRVGWEELAPAADDRGSAIAEALRHADRAPPKERALMRAWSAHLAGDDERAIELCQEVTNAFPDDKQALYLAGDILWHREDFAAAIPLLSRVLKLDPTFEFALDHLSYSLALMGPRDELAGWVRTWSAMAPTAAVLRALVAGDLGLADGSAAIATARRALEIGSASYALTDLAKALAFAGEYGALESELRSRGPRLPAGLRFSLALAIAAQGRRAEALRLLDALARSAGAGEASRDVRYVRAIHLAGDGDAAGVWHEAEALLGQDGWLAARLAPLLARLGDLAHARELAARLEPSSPSLELFLAIVDWKEGRRGPARARLASLERRAPAPKGTVAPAFLRAEMAAEDGLDADVLEALDRFRRLPFQAYWWSWAHPKGLLLFARSLERLGRRDEARVEVGRLLRLWSRADPGLPLLEEARALEARLQAFPVGTTPAPRGSPPGAGSPGAADRR